MTNAITLHDFCKNVKPDRNPARIYYPISYEKPEANIGYALPRNL
jgi:hypothetical protein